MNYLPVLDYGADIKQTAPGNDADSAPMPPQSGPAKSCKDSGKPPTGSQKASARKKDSTKQSNALKPAEARRKMVYQVMERFLDQGAFSDADLLQSVASMSGNEFRQVAEERALAGLCGNPRCRQGILTQQPHAHYKVQGQVVYDVADASPVTCSKKCQALIDMVAGKLGNEDAALYRFTHPTPPAQPVAPARPPALSNTVVERNPSGGPSSDPPAAPNGPLPTPSIRAGSSSRGQVGGGVGGPSHPPRKGSRGLPKYAAGNAKTPIMLADVKEKDPAADEALAAAQALNQQSRQNSQASQVNAQAVEGFVPKARSTKAHRPDVSHHTHDAQHSTYESPTQPSSLAMASAQATDKATEPLNAVQGNDLAAQAPAKALNAGQNSTSQVGGDQPQEAVVNTASDAVNAAATTAAESQPTRGATAAAQHEATLTAATQKSPLGTASQQLGGTAQQRRAGSNAQHCSKRLSQQPNSDRPVQPDDSSNGHAAAEGPTQQQPLPSGSHLEAASNGRPILEFEIDDAEGPMEGAAHDLSTQFGRLKVVASAADTSTQADFSHQSHDAHLRQHYRHQPSPDDPESSGSDQNDQTSNASSAAMNLRDAGSDEEEDANTWLADPPTDFRTEMTPFGAIYTLLDTWPTESTRAYLTASDNAAQHRSESATFGTSKEMLKTMSLIFSRVVPVVSKELQISVSRSTVEQHLHELLTTMYFSTPIPAIKDAHWQILVLVLMKALSLHRLIALQDTFLSRKGLLLLSRLLQTQEFTNELFDALLEILVEGS